MFEARGLTKRYQTLLAVNDVNFTIGPGEILGYLGPNGSGKSTTINMVVGLLEPSSGWTALFGQRLDEHPEDYKRRVGYVPEEPHVYTHLTAIEYLELVGRLRRLPSRLLHEKIATLLQLFDLWDSRFLAMAGFSKGMRQRVLLCAALMHGPDLLVLDEPFSGLDVNAGMLYRILMPLPTTPMAWLVVASILGLVGGALRWFRRLTWGIHPLEFEDYLPSGINELRLE